MKKLYFITSFCLLVFAVKAQVPVNQLSVPYTQNFNALPDTGLSNPYSLLPSAWFAAEVGSGANQLFRAAYGQLAGGDLYSFGDTIGTDRALGSIGSGAVSEIYYGVALVNNTNQVVNALRINYLGEQWRNGNPNRSTGADTLHFSYAINANSITSGNYTSYSNANFFSVPISGIPNETAMNGSLLQNQRTILDTLFGLQLNPNDTLWLRWYDFNSASFDDALAIDDVSLSFLQISTTPPPAGNAGVISIDSFRVDYEQNFDNLSATYPNATYSTLPVGWYAQEAGNGANQLYRVAYGELATGDLYSFGDSLSIERSLGSIGSGSVNRLDYGAAWVNNTGSAIDSIRISYTGEQWRLGNPNRTTGPDSLKFSYAINTTGIAGSGFTNFADLDFISPVTTGTANTALNGNLPINQTNKTAVLNNLSLQNGDTLWIRWTDFDSNSFDDALSIDNFELEALNSLITPPAPLVGYIGLNQFNTTYSQDFDSLRFAYGTHSFNTLPNGWYAKEVGVNANTTYNVAYGEFAGGNMYSFGDSASSERALGSIGSGSILRSDYGSAYINLTGQTINNLEISFMGEQWRLGNPARATGPDTLHFSYAINANGIDDAAYTSFSQLNFMSPATSGTANTPLNGNLAANRTLVNAVLFGLSLQPNDTLWIRWSDFDSNSFDDGLAIDSFNITPILVANAPFISFQDANTIVPEETGLVSIPLVITNKSAFLSEVEVFVADSANISMVTDVQLVPQVVRFFPSNPDSIAYFNFAVLNTDPFEQDEFFVLGLRSFVNGVPGNIIYDTITIANFQYPVETISAVKINNASGANTRIGDAVQVNGIIHGINYGNAGAKDFYILDGGNNGLNVFIGASENVSANVIEGNEVTVWGKIGQFRGLTRLESLDSVRVNSSSNALVTPVLTSANALNETTEGKYIEFEDLRLHPQMVNWPFNLEVYAINNATSDTLPIFIGANSDLAGTPAPTGTFSIVGIGSQFNPSHLAPFLSGYRLMAIDQSRVSVQTSTKQLSQNNPGINVYPNPTQGLVNLVSPTEIKEVIVINALGQIVGKYAPSQTRFELDLQAFKSGIYWIQVRNSAGISVSKIVKN